MKSTRATMTAASWLALAAFVTFGGLAIADTRPLYTIVGRDCLEYVGCTPGQCYASIVTVPTAQCSSGKSCVNIGSCSVGVTFETCGNVLSTTDCFVDGFQTIVCVGCVRFPTGTTTCVSSSKICTPDAAGCDAMGAVAVLPSTQFVTCF